MNRDQAQTIAASIARLRPDWLETSLMTLLADFQHRPARDVHLALVWIAYDPATKTPGRIRENGPWWASVKPIDEPTPLPYYDRYTQTPTDPPADIDTIRRIRAEAKEVTDV